MEREVLEAAIDAAQEEILALVRVTPEGSLGPASITAYELDTLAALVAAAKASS